MKYIIDTVIPLSEDMSHKLIEAVPSIIDINKVDENDEEYMIDTAKELSKSYEDDKIKKAVYEAAIIGYKTAKEHIYG